MMRIIILIIAGFFFFSCGKEFLEAKPDKALVVPKNLNDFQALLDDVNQQINQTPGLIEVATDDFIGLDGSLDFVSKEAKNVYLWKTEVYESANSPDWHAMYTQVLRTNVILDELNKIDITVGNEKQYDAIKGSALFFRAWHFFGLLQTFSMPYDLITSKEDLGIILKVKADINEKPERATVEESYLQIITDLEEAVKLLPSQVIYPSRPNLAAAYALLARVYLSRFDYEKAEYYSSLSLNENDMLLNFNDLVLTNSFPDPFLDINKEMLLFSIPILYATNFLVNAFVDFELYKQYLPGDLRKEMYFKEISNGQAQIKASYYVNSLIPFTGITSSEMYLIKAECLARLDKLSESLKVLNALLQSRWDENYSYRPLNAADQEEVLDLVLQERRKELIFRGLRWYDLRRLNKEDRFAKTLRREYNGEVFTLPPNSSRYAFAIPFSEIQANPKIIQNVRGD